MTQALKARSGAISDEVLKVAAGEEMEPEALRRLVADGRAVIPINKKRIGVVEPCGAGVGLTTKVNANIGTSMDAMDPEMELRKLRAALEAKTDMVMDLSTGGEIREIRKRLLAECTVPLGTVPVYEAASNAARFEAGMKNMRPTEMIDVIRRQAADGVDFITIHCGVTRAVAETLDKNPRVCGMVSRGGTFIYHWMRVNGQENPYYAKYDEIIDICLEHDMTISLGDGMRPGAGADAFDPAQVHELHVMAELCRQSRAAGVQTIVEGPGHVPLDQVAAQMKLEKALTDGAPFYVLGPLVTDIAPGHDHMVGAIGGALASMHGADILCYLTPSEHLGLPDEDDVYRGVIATRIAAHAGDIAKGLLRAKRRDLEFSKKRKERDWKFQIENSIDPKTAGAMFEKKKSSSPDRCTMCGPYCVFKVVEDPDA